MKDGKKTKDQLIEELLSLRRRVADLEGSDAGGRSRPEVPSGLEERYRTLFEHASDAIIVADPEGNFLEVNRKAEDLLGYGKEELLRMKVTDIHPREELDRVVLHFSGAVAGRIDSLHDTRLLRKDGTVVPADITGCFVEYEGKRLAQGIFRNIAERKEMEETLRKSEEQLRVLSENLADGMVYQINSGADGRQRVFTYVSPAVERFHGVKVEDAMMDPSLIYDQVGAEYRTALKESETRACATMSRFEIDVPMRLPSGDVRWRRLISFPHLHSDGSVMWDGIELDVTERRKMEEELAAHRDHLGKLVEERTARISEEVARRKEKEEQYLSLVESIKEWVWEMNADLVHTYVSPRIREILGYEPEEFIGRAPFDFMAPGEPERIAPLAKKILSGKEQFTSLGTAALHKNGQVVYLEASGRPFFDDKGTFLGYRGSCHDITDQKKTMDALRERERELTAKSEALEEVNAALKVLLRQREEDREELEARLVSNIREMVLPYIHKMRKDKLDLRHRTFLDIVAANLNEIMSPFPTTIKQLNFTPREIEVASLIKEGRTTKEIAEFLGIATSAVDSHRNNIRTKLGLNNKKINLRSHLLSLG
ncbi:MAG TPA: PAS domain S-box protein [Syntrophorhabdaceae bacterium]|nr:PAS domain S-box protein [Syntrophorhabdaceae bacterium]